MMDRKDGDEDFELENMDFLTKHFNRVLSVAIRLTNMGEEDRQKRDVGRSRRIGRPEMRLYLLMCKQTKSRPLFTEQEYRRLQVVKRRIRGMRMIRDQKDDDWVDDNHYRTLYETLESKGWDAFVEAVEMTAKCALTLNPLKEKYETQACLEDSDDSGSRPRVGYRRRSTPLPNDLSAVFLWGVLSSKHP